MLGERLQQYVNRAEELKTILSPPSTPGGGTATATAVRPPDGGAGAGAGGGSGAGDDPEKAKMRGALAGACLSGARARESALWWSWWSEGAWVLHAGVPAPLPPPPPPPNHPTHTSTHTVVWFPPPLLNRDELGVGTFF
jgi:hypothetical protein